MTGQANRYTSATDGLGNTLREGDYVIANIRDYHRAGDSGSARRLVHGTITGFAGENKIRMEVEEEITTWRPNVSWVKSAHAVLVAPKDMVDSYKEAYANYTESGD